MPLELLDLFIFSFLGGMVTVNFQSRIKDNFEGSASNSYDKTYNIDHWLRLSRTGKLSSNKRTWRAGAQFR